jgi:N-dimethylarginine dimethylaminohydrolase
MKEAGPLLSAILNKEVIPLELVDPYFYHLDTCFAPLNEDTVLINPGSFTESGLKTIRKYFKTILLTQPEDNQIMACNLICHDKIIISGKGFSEKLKSSLHQAGFMLIEVPMSQYIKGGGSVKCCSLILES